MKCEICEFEWVPRVKSPKACPRCKRYNYYKDTNKQVQIVKQ